MQQLLLISKVRFGLLKHVVNFCEQWLSQRFRVLVLYDSNLQLQLLGCLFELSFGAIYLLVLQHVVGPLDGLQIFGIARYVVRIVFWVDVSILFLVGVDAHHYIILPCEQSQILILHLHFEFELIEAGKMQSILALLYLLACSIQLLIGQVKLLILFLLFRRDAVPRHRRLHHGHLRRLLGELRVLTGSIN